MKSYRTLRPLVIGDTRYDKGVVVEMIEKQAAALIAAGHIEAVEPSVEVETKPAPKARNNAAKDAAE